MPNLEKVSFRSPSIIFINVQLSTVFFTQLSPYSPTYCMSACFLILILVSCNFCTLSWIHTISTITLCHIYGIVDKKQLRIDLYTITRWNTHWFTWLFTSCWVRSEGSMSLLLIGTRVIGSISKNPASLKLYYNRKPNSSKIYTPLNQYSIVSVW